MRALLPGIATAAATLALAAPAEAQRWTNSGSIPATNVTVHRGSPDRDFGFRRFGFDRSLCDFGGRRDRRDGREDRHHRDRDRRLSCDLFVGGWGAPEAWALYNNRTWDSDSYNDWWHDRPDRAYPRWVRNNRDCSPDRMWWSGAGWRC
jgi:hypothetical protein